MTAERPGPIPLRRRTVPERLEYIADQLDRALDPSCDGYIARVRSAQVCLLAMAAEFTDAPGSGPDYCPGPGYCPGAAGPPSERPGTVSA